MADLQQSQEFSKEVIAAIEERENWFNTTQLPKVQDDYRLHLTCVRNLFDSMVKRGLITPDPYKADKKITDITCPETGEFTENEKSMVLGTRLSDYESIIDYICNYTRFTVDQLTMEKIRKLIELNATFNWGNVSSNANKPNTKALSSAITTLRQGAPQITLSLIKDSTTKSANALKEVNDVLKLLADFHKERYKAEVRKNILLNPQFNAQNAYSSGNTLFTEIKKLFPSLMQKKSFSADPINELIAEELGSDAADRRTKLLNKLKVEKESKVKKEEKIDTKILIMEAVRVLGTVSEQYALIYDKFNTNHGILQDEKKTFGHKLASFFRKMFGIAEPQVEYEVLISDKATESQKKERINFNLFMENLGKRIRYYGSFSIKNSPGYSKIYSQEESVIADFLNRQITENNHLFAQFTAFDNFFKKSATAEDRAKIKGILMELTTVKNTLVKVRQIRAEYVSYIEEQQQMQKLGISNHS